VREGYWPRLPTEMPWVPLQRRFWTRIWVELGLKDTQSVSVSLGKERRKGSHTVAVGDR
jgi:hypothetical protein